MILIKLKRCPFCGGDATFGVRVEAHTITAYIAKCESCEIHTKEYPTQEAAATKWNTRQADKGIILVEDGSVDLDECKELGLRPLVYRNGAALPIILKGENK